jgi:hypothetical protein
MAVAGGTGSATPSPTASAKPCATDSPTASAKPSATKSGAPVVAGKLLPPQKVKAVFSGKCLRVSWQAPVAMVGKKVNWYKAVVYTYTDWLIASCTVKPFVLACSMPIGDTNGSVRIRVFVAYQGTSVLTAAKDIILKAPK